MKTGLLAALAAAICWAGPLEDFRDRQDRQALERAAETARAGAEKRQDAASFRALALAYSYLAEVAQETGDKAVVRDAAGAGIRAAERAVALEPESAENRRLLGTLCGQIVPANVLAGLKYGKRAREELERAIELDPRSAMAYVSRGVGNYYLPKALGGGIDLAIEDFEKAIALDASLHEAHLWLGIALRKANRNPEARKALETAVKLNPQRVWAKQQLEKTPAT